MQQPIENNYTFPLLPAEFEHIYLQNGSIEMPESRFVKVFGRTKEPIGHFNLGEIISAIKTDDYYL